MKKKVEPLPIIRYSTLASCMKEYGVSPKTRGWWEWADADGTRHRESVQNVIKNIKRRSCWGWVDNKERIHVWVGKRATLKDVVLLMSHEFGHIQRPYSRDRYREETKAARYAEVAVMALKVAKDLLPED